MRAALKYAIHQRGVVSPRECNVGARQWLREGAGARQLELLQGTRLGQLSMCSRWAQARRMAFVCSRTVLCTRWERQPRAHPRFPSFPADSGHVPIFSPCTPPPASAIPHGVALARRRSRRGEQCSARMRTPSRRHSASGCRQAARDQNVAQGKPGGAAVKASVVVGPVPRRRPGKARHDWVPARWQQLCCCRVPPHLASPVALLHVTSCLPGLECAKRSSSGQKACTRPAGTRQRLACSSAQP